MAGLSDAKLLERLRSGPDPDAAEALFLRHADAVYGLCLRILGEEHLAEDAAQETCLKILNRAELFRPGEPGNEARAWVLGIAAHASLDLLRRERRLTRRERAKAGARPAREAEKPDAQAESAELARAASLAVEALEMDLRVPVLLCCVEGLRHEDAARVLGLSRRAVGLRVERGLEKLRRKLAGAGLALAPGALALGLSMAPAQVAPPGLVASVPRLAAAGSKTAATGTSVVLKGGITMKLVAGIVLAGAIAAGVAVVGGGGPGELPAEKPRFPIPVWSPDARWESKPEVFIGSGALGHLDGPRREVMWGRATGSARGFLTASSGPYGCYSYDPKSERLHFVAGSVRGYMDGPLSRARFGSHDYSHRSRTTRSPDGRYFYMTEPWNNHVLRRVDLVKQEVRTIMPGSRGMALAADNEGRIYTVKRGDLLVVAPDGKVERKQALDMQEKFGGLQASITLDEVNGRLYGSGYGTKKWFVWYWDIKDGSFHGVLPRFQKGEPKRARNEAGPFKGTDLYGEMGNWFGQDDPERKFLYLTPNDTMTCFRLDLEKKIIWALSREKTEALFISSGKPRGKFDWSTRMNGEGDVTATVPPWNGAQLIRFKRVK